MNNDKVAPARILITHWVHPPVLARLREAGEVIANESLETWPAQRLREAASVADAVMMFMPDRVDADFLDACPRLKIVAAALKGYDNFDVAACTARRVWLTRVPGLLTDPTAELAIGLLLAVTRRMLAGDDHVRSGGFAGWRPRLYGTGLGGRTLGIIGLGAVGRAIVRRLSGFGMRIVYADPEPAPAELVPNGALERLSLERLLEQSDFVLPLVHLNAHTRHMIGARALRAMKPGAYLINVGRGSVVDESAVADALDGGQLGGYAADVFELEDWALEDRPRQIDSRLIASRERTFFTPHLGSAVEDVRRDIAMEAAENIIDALQGRRPRGAVNAF